MTVSSLNSVMPTTQVAASASKGVAAYANHPTSSTTQSDSVQLSPEAIQAQRQEKYALKTDPMEFYNDWLNTSPRYLKLEGEKPYEKLLPETQAYVDQLHERLQNAQSPSERRDIEAYISGASRFGDKEMVQSDHDLETRWKVEGVAMNLQLAHLEIHNEEIAVPEGFEKPDISDHYNVLTREDMIRRNEEIGISREQTLADFAEIDRQNRQSLEDFYYGWMNGTRTLDDAFLTRPEDQWDGPTTYRNN